MPIPTILYFVAYMALVTPIFIIIYKINAKTVSQINKRSVRNKYQTIWVPLIFLSLGGLPPLTGFFPKWFSIYLISPNSFTMLIFLLVGSLLNLYYYLNIVFSSILASSKSQSWYKNLIPTSSLTIYVSLTILPLAPLLII